jgi:adenylate kinase family enzyme
MASQSHPAQRPLMRIMIVGPTGAGKTTLAREAARITGLPHIEFDELFWEANWNCAPDAVVRQRLEKLTAGPCWILDGNFLQHKDAVWNRADALVWLDFPMPLTFSRTLKRTILRCFYHEILWGKNMESWRHAVLSRNSVLRWALKNWRVRRRQYEHIVHSSECNHMVIHRFHGPHDAQRWLEELARNHAVPQLCA